MTRLARLAACLSGLGASCLFLWVRPAGADTINYVAMSTYTSTTATTTFSVPNTTFTFTFSIDSSTLTPFTNVNGSTFLTTGPGATFVPTVPLTFTLGSGPCCTFSGLGLMIFAPAGVGGLFDVSFVGGVSGGFEWKFFGPQIWSGTTAPFTLLTGTFPVNAPPSTLSQFFGNGGFAGGNFSGGTVTATVVPEPSSLLLFGSGLLGLGPLLRRLVRV